MNSNTAAWPAEIAVGRLRLHQELQPTADVVAVGAVEMRVAGAQEGQEHQTGHGRCGVAARILSATAGHVVLFARLMGARVPTAVGRLIVGKPFEPGLYGGFRLGRATMTLCYAGPIGSHAEPISVGHSRLSFPDAILGDIGQSEPWDIRGDECGGLWKGRFSR